MSKEAMEIHFQQSMESAGRLEELAIELRQIAEGRYEEFLKNVRSNWEGNAGEFFCQKGLKLQQAMEISANNLSEISKSVYNAAERIYEAEKQAIIMAKDRKY